MKFVLSGIAKYYLIYDELMFKCQKTLDTFSSRIHRCYKEKKEKKKSYYPEGTQNIRGLSHEDSLHQCSYLNVLIKTHQ